MSKEKVVRNILKSLLKRFNMKVISIEEARDVFTMKVDELIGSLLAFKVTIDDKSEKKVGVVFKVDTEYCDDREEHVVDENVNESIKRLAKSICKVMRRFDKRSENNVFANVKDNKHKNSKGGNF